MHEDASLILLQYRRAMQLGDLESALVLVDPGRLRTSDLRRELARQLPFWKGAAITQECCRVVGPDVVEVYERIEHASTDRALRVVSVVHRTNGRWGIIDTRDAPDERLVGHICCDDVALNSAFFDTTVIRAENRPHLTILDDRRALLTWDSGLVAELVLQSAHRALTVPLRSRVDHERVVTLSAGLVEDAFLRRGQIAQFGAALAAIAQSRGPWVQLVNERVLHTRQLIDWAASANEHDARRLAQLWVRTMERSGLAFTRGLALFGLPELEIVGAENGRKKLERAAAQLVVHPSSLQPGEHYPVGEAEYAVRPGRRGPGPGLTYGRYGALRLVPPTRPVRRSGIRATEKNQPRESAREARRPI